MSTYRFDPAIPLTAAELTDFLRLLLRTIPGEAIALAYAAVPSLEASGWFVENSEETLSNG